ncbi:hypothetical protein AMAG_19616 [Allomyces macrogynus ATCC 38327]|uniref:Uncharacterized protein n=1 Tax=Allomyces macrogynus (strain ATCC 38327) TaxID=578462 RepID=A0A0L0SYA7_ALLM3|nr:hypothetical protein AMAG_19616 [Allomyces macrogynus ATCC 38327]|eukprot:KNE67334.1 hypothetical protein AMAG_19616 [Allomyces macrogynus ATCC 38327]
MEATLNQLAPVPAAERCTRTCAEWLQLRNATSSMPSLSKRQADRLQVMSAASAPAAGSANPLQQCVNDFTTAVCVDSSVRELIMEEITQQWLQLDVYCALNSPMSTFSLLPSSQADVRHLLVQSPDLDTTKLYPTGLFTGLHAPESTKAASASTSSTEFCYDPLASLFFNQPERSDRVLVMEAGQLVEFDEPLALLDRPNGHFASLVANTGEATAAKLRVIAQAAHNERVAKRTTKPDAAEDPALLEHAGSPTAGSPAKSPTRSVHS